MSELSENITKVKKILEVSDDKLDNYLSFCESTITQKIFDICHIEELPTSLNLVIQEFLLEQYKLNQDGIKEGKTEVSNVSDNGQSISLKSIGGTSSMSNNADEFLEKNMKTLVKYRKVAR